MSDVSLSHAELEARQDEIRARVQEVEDQFGDSPYTDEVRSEVDRLDQEYERNETHLDELRQRKARLAKIAARGGRSVEPGDDRGVPNVHVGRPDNIYDLSTLRANLLDPASLAGELRDRAMRAVESTRGLKSEQQDRVSHLLDVVDDEREAAPLAQRILRTGSPVYLRAFGKYITGKEMSTAEERAALAAGAGGTGGFAVPFTLDPTVIHTSDGSINPLRGIARVETITTTTWQGVSSEGVAAAYATEAQEATDNAPTLLQPEVDTLRAQAFIPFSIEIGQDWGALRSEMVTMLQDAKDDLEADKFVNGDGSGEPQGIVDALSGDSLVDTDGDFAAEHVYQLEEELPPRFRSRAQFLASKKVYNLIRQFADADGHDLWERIGAGTPARLLGYPSLEASEMSTDVTTDDERFLLFGDFRHFVIVDRVGMDVELVPHLFGNSNRYPTGQRGLYAFWRNNTELLANNAFRVLVKTTAT